MMTPGCRKNCAALCDMGMLADQAATRACLLACRHCRASATTLSPAGELTADGRSHLRRGRPYRAHWPAPG
jgi:hypothetical protein